MNKRDIPVAMQFLSRWAVFLAVFALVPCTGRLGAQEAAAAAHTKDKLLIETSTAPVFLGKATLTVNPLSHRDGAYAGTYQIEVSPLSVASEKGDLSVTVPDDAVRKLGQNMGVSFHGQATNAAGKHRTIDGTATPRGADHGNLTLKILSERGKLVFHTTYRFSAN